MKTHLKVDENYALIPVDNDGIKYVFNRTVGDILSCEIKIERNYHFLQKYFVLIKTMFDQQEHFDSQESFRRWIQMKSGYYSTIVAPNGNTIFHADSISFDKMSEEDFAKLYSAVIDVFLKEFGRGQTENDLLQIIGFV